MEKIFADPGSLKPFAEPVEPATLEQGQVYFSINYSDPAMTIPFMEPLVFIGRDLEAGDQGQLYFQDVDSYSAGIRYGTVAGKARPEISSSSDRETNHIFEFHKAIEELLRCAIRRKCF